MYPNMHTQRKYPRRGKEKGEKSKDRSEKKRSEKNLVFILIKPVLLSMYFFLSMTGAGS